MDAGEKGSEHESAGLISIVGDVSKLTRQLVQKSSVKADPARLSDIKEITANRLRNVMHSRRLGVVA